MVERQNEFPVPAFLPMTRADMDRLGWDRLDVLLVTGDAYVDHPTFGAALLGRWLGAHGFKVGICAQPRWDSPEDVVRMGRPKLFVGVTAGALDSMLAHYTAFRKKRHDDAYTPGGRAGARPNRASIQYTSLVRNAFPEVPVVLGGIEASLRRASHYDFWTDKVRRSILLDSKADVVVYGMGERAILELAHRAQAHFAELESLHLEPHARRAGSPGAVRRAILGGVPGTARIAEEAEIPAGVPVIRLPSHEEILADPAELMRATLALERQVHDAHSWAVQYAEGRMVLIAPPAQPLPTEELDRLYALPFSRRAHPSYREPVPALEMIQFSVTSHRGCAGGCSFCSLALHQGRRIRSRSRESILREVREVTRHPDWKGSVTDVGGPSANMWGATCIAEPAKCRRVSCLQPDVCPNFKVDQSGITDLLRAIARVPGVKSVRVASGVRHDLASRDEDYVRALVTEFVGGQLKLAPEHRCDFVLCLMRKPRFEMFERFLTLFERVSREAGKEQYVIPYLMTAFPGTTDRDMQDLSDWLSRHGWRPQQVQCFIPTPGTVATAMFHAGIDPEGKPVPVARTDAERLRQHRILMGDRDHGPSVRPHTRLRPDRGRARPKSP